MLLNNKVLLLNSSYEPLLVVTAKKAILLYFTDKVEIIENSNKIVRSIYIEFQIPSIIRLKKYVYVKKKELSLTRKNVLKRDAHTCQYCGCKNLELTLDHIIPKDKGGIDSWNNLVAACKKCNIKKGNKLLKDIQMNLIKLPSKPSYLLNLREYARINSSWKPYLYLKNKGI
tara:strand:+ start:20 stop:535 length:516 start_codon:yes stop_codon:yes gene_type:complete